MSWYLHGSGRKTRNTWHELLELAGGWTASWADHLGFHQDKLPAEPPKTTHLWAWTRHRWLRVRVDHDHWWAALLVEGNKIEGPPWIAPEPVDPPNITPFTNWGSHRTVKQYRPAAGAEDVLNRYDMLQLVPLRQTTALFIGDNTTR
ncbi:hypothetical protein A8924_5491 [Saccharopolyspora erythraea NRRL 2338]|uniref:Uncharacterized protein n=1 Tax=Saccharopolyspora erythraea TaxID=1836 RepID=A0ABP3PE45_SACER|nr:hypothetical protein N599_33175 [Saccharopolyspora erythraea D]PFG97998.1 hypothetical protein A8924_5491 [Saccharopolyspora erythraea NRRL 2338]